jgi:hypothetical protein
MNFGYIALGIFMVTYFLLEGFEAVVLPRAVTHSWRFTSWFYRLLWLRIWKPTATKFSDFRKRDNFLSVFGPLSLILLLQVWALGLIIGFGLIQHGLATDLYLDRGNTGLLSDLYFSGTTFFTLGLGDLVPHDRAGRFVAVLEAGTGFGFLAIIKGYLPVIYGAFSRREASITLLDARAGSPPTALEMIRRHVANNAVDDLQVLMHDLERWASELMESHLSYPVLCYYRSQHDDQSWISALTVAMDTAALMMVGLKGVPRWTAKLMFAMGRHALIDLSLIFRADPARKYLSRLSQDDFERIKTVFDEIGCGFHDSENAASRLTELRSYYEPYCVAMARIFDFSLPPFAAFSDVSDDWQKSAWDRVEHF